MWLRIYRGLDISQGKTDFVLDVLHLPSLIQGVWFLKQQNGFSSKIGKLELIFFL